MKVLGVFDVIGQDHWFRTLLDNTMPTLLVLMFSFKTNPYTQWRTKEGGSNPPPEIPKFWQSRTKLQIEQKMFSVPIPTS